MAFIVDLFLTKPKIFFVFNAVSSTTNFIQSVHWYSKLLHRERFHKLSVILFVARNTEDLPESHVVLFTSDRSPKIRVFC